ncbi:hypothetical protein ACVQ90_11775 [Staphylococcus aureus]
MTELKCACNKLFSILVRGPNKSKIGFPISTDNASWGVGPNKEKLDSQFLQTMQVGVWAPNTENFERNSTGKASWGGTTNKFYENIISVPLPWCQLA